ncbi:diaminopimelate decarboxylase [Bacillus tamaricis]|uniref:Diaminopimelate decarboxylase n=2 Tax=Evansella tamaricis TaxID=2069301 RepID=A0ABS6JES0_9BACI|nr:diaminopimelate decarboxylase [Evansella tamaricis]
MITNSTELSTYSQNYKTLSNLEQEHGSSFYLLDIDRLQMNYKKMETAFKSRYEKFIIGYSYKTNYIPYLCKELDKLGAYAEVVSKLEYDLALKIGVVPTKIIFNGPLKTKYDIETALNMGSILNIDSTYEMKYVKEHCLQNPDTSFKVGFRVNFDISTNGVSPLVEGFEKSRFGMCVENGSFQLVWKQLKELPNLKITGLHGHFSTANRSVSTFEKITQSLCDIVKEYKLTDLEYIDIGGGIFGEVPRSLISNTPTFDDYGEAVCKIMNKEFGDKKEKPYLILEPGISMVANTFQFVAKVVETKNIRNETFVLVDGSVHNIKPTMHKKNLPMRVIRSSVDDGSNRSDTYHIVGYTCLEKDYLACDVKSQMPLIGDFIIFENVGAYTLVFNPPFIKERPAVVAFYDGKTTIARKKESFKEFFNDKLYQF